MILAVINQMSEAEVVLKKAFEIAKEERVDVLFVHEPSLFDLEEILMDVNKSFDKAKTKALLKEKIKNYTDKEVAIIVKEGDSADAIYDLLKESKDLVITFYHSDIAKNMVKKLKQDILFIKADTIYKNAVLVVESLEGIKAALDFAKQFSPKISLYYNFYYTPDVAVLDPSLEVDLQTSELILEETSKEFENLCKELEVEGRLFVNGVDEEEELSEAINKKGFLLTIYKKDEDEFFIGDMGIELLENVGSDFLVIHM